MRILLFTDSRKGISAFGTLGRSRTHCLELHDRSELRRLLRTDLSDAFLYLDISGLTLASARSRMKNLNDAAPGRFGIVDPADLLKDPAEVFHKGGVDYLGKRALSGQFSASRLTRVLEAARGGIFQPGVSTAVSPVGIIPSGADWSDVEYGNEYTFQMLYVGIDDAPEIARKSSESLLQNLRRSFQSLLERSFAGADGRIWVWKEYDGVVLFPFDGSRLTALIPAARLFLNSVLINMEHFSGMPTVSWRMGLHVGNTTYRAPGETSAIVSEALNFVFHLGERALASGEFAVTAPALAFASEKIRTHIQTDTQFESVPFGRFPRCS